MPDHAHSSSPAVQAQLDRLWRLSPGLDVLGLDRITRLLARLGDPHRHLPPVFHVAGTNGKGSTCAFLRAAIEASGGTAHVYSSPHLVRFNERIRVAGRLIGDDLLATLLAEVLDQADGIGASFFEVTTTAAFLAFARTPATSTIVEVGLGGRLDATNVVTPLVTGIAQLGIDHQSFLGNTAEDIAGEKAGIAKRGVPLVTMRYPPAVAGRIAEVAAHAGAPVVAEGSAWHHAVDDAGVNYTDAGGTFTLPPPALIGAHQASNLTLATAMLRHQHAVAVPIQAMTEAASTASWPARMQRLRPGPLTDLLPASADLWLDGGHNAAAAQALAAALRLVGEHRPIHLVLGMLANKDAPALLAPLAPLTRSMTAVPVPGHEGHAPLALTRYAREAGFTATGTAPDLPAALRQIAGLSDPRGVPPCVLIAGSLYLAGQALADNEELPE